MVRALHRGRRALTHLRLAGLIAAVLAAAFGAPPAAAEESVLRAVEDRGALRVAGVVYPPLIMRRPSGEYYGADPDLLRALAAELGVELQFVNAAWDEAVPGLAIAKWDIAPALCISSRHRYDIDYAETYLMLGGVLAVLAGNEGIDSLADANRLDVTFANVTGGWGEQIAEKAFPDATHKSFGQATQAEMAMEVISGRADATVVDTPVTVSRLARDHGDRLAFFPDRNTPIDVLSCSVAYGIRKGDAGWEATVSDFIRRKRESGELRALLDKHVAAELLADE